MKSKYIRFILFLIINFFALAVGVWLMGNEPTTDWYLSLNKAPWTPEGWVFGAAWSLIMFCFSFYMTKLTFLHIKLDNKLWILYLIQWILNVSWNYFFFNQHLTIIGLVIIFLLWLLIVYFTFGYLKKMSYYTTLILPYLIWITIATSLNAYIVFQN